MVSYMGLPRDSLLRLSTHFPRVLSWLCSLFSCCPTARKVSSPPRVSNRLSYAHWRSTGVTSSLGNMLSILFRYSPGPILPWSFPISSSNRSSTAPGIVINYISSLIYHYIMVLESVVVPERWERHPKRMFIIGFTYASIGLFLGLWVFGKYSSIVGIFLTTLPLVVVMYRAIKCEEEKDLRICSESKLMKEHMHILYFFIYLFIGLVAAYSFWFTFLPEDTVNKAFGSQIETLSVIHGRMRSIGSATAFEEFKSLRLEAIVKNNLRVLAFCILFSFLYGAGAIFILTWNASVIGVAIGNVVREGIQVLAGYGHSNVLINYFSVLPVGLGYMVHGIPEVASYFLGALAGGIISSAVVCHHFRSEEFWRVVRDSLDLVILSLLVLLLSAFIEVYITPILI
ncbi:MAG: hypothetical protein GF416_07280 [Candidatus Altiarchaeales archaeon]|nr:hypothetical protein [Candidatus Altiarchaeales archaeon]MBD3416914.1 hypothetical protein [Candidatus Altiarchaeales archaeon]